MKKLFNLRFVFVYFIVVILGIILARVVSCIPNFSQWFLIILAFASINLLILSIILYKKYTNVFLQITTIFTVFVMAFVSCLSYSSWLNKDGEKITNGVYTLSGEISEVDYADGVVYLKNIYVAELDTKLNGEARIYWHQTEVEADIVRGDTLETVCYVYSRDVNSSFSGFNQTVTAYSNGTDNIKIIPSTKLKDKLKRRVYKILCETNDNLTTAQIEFAMLFGDKDRLDEGLKDSYSVTGLAHILAVSGLHIGFVVAIIYNLVKKILRHRHWLTLAITSAFVIAYLYLCDFAISAVRAVLMTIVIYYAKARGKQYDALCGLSLAGIIILLVSPFDLFNVGFQLSFTVVFSLFCLSPPISGLLSSYMPKKLASTLSVCISTFLGSILVVAYYFKNCSALAILSNMIIIPVVSVAFTLLFVFSILACVFRSLDFLLVIPNLLYDCINIVVNSIAELGLSGFLFSTNVIGVLLGLLAIFILSDYIFLSRKQKACIVGIIICFIGMSVVYSNYRILEEMAEVSHYEIY